MQAMLNDQGKGLCSMYFCTKMFQCTFLEKLQMIQRFGRARFSLSVKNE